jgi:hypothetical protein
MAAYGYQDRRNRYVNLNGHVRALADEYYTLRAQEAAGESPHSRTVARGDLAARALEIKSYFEEFADIFRAEAARFQDG